MFVPKRSVRIPSALRAPAVKLAALALLLILAAPASWIREYADHRAAVVPPLDPVTESGGFSTGSAALVLPDLAAESRESVLIGPNPAIRERLRSLFSSANEEILVTVYLLTDDGIVDSLVSAAKRGVKVKAVLERDPYKLPGANRKSADRLRSAGAEVLAAQKDAFAFVHAKYAVVDGREYVFSTGNYAKTTFAKNREFFVFGKDPATASFLREVFLADFRGSPFSFPVPSRSYLAPSDARTKLLSFIGSARSSVTVFAPSLSDPELIRSLSEAVSMGKRVRICLARDSELPNVSASGGDLGLARTSGPPLHAKTVLVDGKALWIGSANFTTNSLDRNREVGAVFAGSGILRNYENTLRADCKW